MKTILRYLLYGERVCLRALERRARARERREPLAAMARRLSSPDGGRR